MKEKVRKFLTTNFVNIPIYISLVCIAIWDSTLALIIYATIIHVSLLLLTLGLYYPDIIKPITKPWARRVLFMVIHTFITVTILVVTEHWYVLCIFSCCMFLAFVHMYDMTKIKDH